MVISFMYYKINGPLRSKVNSYKVDHKQYGIHISTKMCKAYYYTNCTYDEWFLVTAVKFIRQ